MWNEKSIVFTCFSSFFLIPSCLALPTAALLPALVQRDHHQGFSFIMRFLVLLDFVWFIACSYSFKLKRMVLHVNTSGGHELQMVRNDFINYAI